MCLWMQVAKQFKDTLRGTGAEVVSTRLLVHRVDLFQSILMS